MALSIRTILVVLAAAATVGACSRTPAGPANWSEAMAPVRNLWTLSKWSEVFNVCEKAFPLGEKEGQGRGVMALDCLAEAAARQGKPEKALPHYEKFFNDGAAQLQQVDATYRIANNHGVLLVEAGKREAGIARLRQALEAVTDDDVPPGGRNFGMPRALIVKNLARAYYDRASEPQVRAWVVEQGEWFRDYIESRKRGGPYAVGAGGALEALVAIGRRQANLDTPAWEALLREWEPVEERLYTQNPTLLRTCETNAINLEVCLLEVKSPL